jgi:hypothetical protein
MVVAVASVIASREPAVRSEAVRRASRATLWVTFAVLFFLIISLLPAVLWRLNHGVWIDG